MIRVRGVAVLQNIRSGGTLTGMGESPDKTSGLPASATAPTESPDAAGAEGVSGAAEGGAGKPGFGDSHAGRPGDAHGTAKPGEAGGVAPANERTAEDRPLRGNGSENSADGGAAVFLYLTPEIFVILNI